MSSKEKGEITATSLPTQPAPAAMRTPRVRFASKDQIQLIEGRNEAAGRGEDEVGEVQPLESARVIPLETVSEPEWTHVNHTGAKHYLAPTLPLLSLGATLHHYYSTAFTCRPMTMHAFTHKY
jgi:hypothetical protein